MPAYESKITFTLDTICPWTYIGKKKLDAALANYALSTNSHAPVNFTLHFAPYQLYPDLDGSDKGHDKREWFTTNKHGGSAEKMGQFEAVMASYGEPQGINFSWDGTIANTLHAHRVIQYFQGSSPSDDDEDDYDDEEERKAAQQRYKTYGPAVASKLVNALYKMYFEESQHPASPDTLLKACVEAGIPEDEARHVVGLGEAATGTGGNASELPGLSQVKRKIRMSKSNGVDSVPSVVFEGRRRDLTLVGAKEVIEYEKALATIVKESS